MPSNLQLHLKPPFSKLKNHTSTFLKCPTGISNSIWLIKLTVSLQAPSVVPNEWVSLPFMQLPKIYYENQNFLAAPWFIYASLTYWYGAYTPCNDWSNLPNHVQFGSLWYQLSIVTVEVSYHTLCRTIFTRYHTIF
jgi:hypothetical protein